MIIARHFFLLFLALVIVEVYAFIKVAQWIGFGYMLLLALATSALGFLLLQMQGMVMREQVAKAFLRGEVSPAVLVEGGMGWIGAFLLIVPGFVTDVLGLLCLLPGVRGFLARRLMARGQDDYEARTTQGAAQDRRTSPTGRRTLEGEYIREDDQR